MQERARTRRAGVAIGLSNGSDEGRAAGLGRRKGEGMEAVAIGRRRFDPGDDERGRRRRSAGRQQVPGLLQCPADRAVMVDHRALLALMGIAIPGSQRAPSPPGVLV